MTDFIELTRGENSAVVSTTGARLRELTVADRPVVVPMGAFDGAVLAPWPNRIADGRYGFHGQEHQLPITEADRNTALHGLVADTEWDISEQDETSASLRTVMSPSPGYPFHLSLNVTYGLGEDGIEIKARARNHGVEPAPFGFGFHPWIHPGAERIDDSQLAIGAQTWFETDDRLIPVDNRPFDTGSLIPADHEPGDAPCIVCKDFRSLRALDSAVLDDAFGTPQRGTDGWSQARLKGADDRTVVIRMDESFRAWQVCTGDELPGEQSRRAIAIEPMTCPPNAFASGTDFDVIEPDGEITVQWSITLT